MCSLLASRFPHPSPLLASTPSLKSPSFSGKFYSETTTIATDAYFATGLASLTSLGYSSYQPGPVQAIALMFDVRYRVTDSAYGENLGLVRDIFPVGEVSLGGQLPPDTINFDPE